MRSLERGFDARVDARDDGRGVDRCWSRDEN
jgi:hypothetical protein